MLGAHFPQKLGRDPTHMVIIGRARVRIKSFGHDTVYLLPVQTGVWRS